jgi:hypothetical protein
MRRFAFVALAGLALMLAVPAASSAAPLAQGEAMKAATEQVGNVEEVRHRRRHVRWRSGWHSRWESRGRRWHRRWHSRRAVHSRWESRRWRRWR